MTSVVQRQPCRCLNTCPEKGKVWTHDHPTLAAANISLSCELSQPRGFR